MVLVFDWQIWFGGEARYLVWANAVAAVVALVQLIIVVAISRQSKAGGWITLLVDQVSNFILLMHVVCLAC